MQKSGYRVSLIFLWLDSVEIALDRVAARVKTGGHSIPEATIRRRYERGLSNLFDLYLPKANSWRIFHASPIIPVEVAWYDEVEDDGIFDEVIWKKIRGR